PVNSALVGVSRPVNPGTHKVSASAPGYTKAERTVDLKEKQKIEVTLSLVSTGGVVYGPTGTGDTGTTNPPPAGSASAAPSASASSTPPPPPPPRDPRSKMSIFLGARLGFSAMAGSLPNGDNVTTTSIGDVAGPGGQLGIEAAFRVVRILYLSLTGDVAGYAGKDYSAPGVTATAQATSLLAAGHIGILTNPDGFGFMGDLGAGYRYYDFKLSVDTGSSNSSDFNFGGIDYILRLGMHFKAGKSIRLFPQAEMDFGSLGTGSTSVSSAGTGVPSDSNSGQTAGHVAFFFGFGGYFDIDLDKGAGKAPTLDTTVK
ncbi:MAG: PEGA domain-containing protein, partial [Polyangiaceae bacterium]